MGFINGGHIWLILLVLLVVLVIWGPGKLPDVGSGMGRAIREFRKTVSGDEDAKPTPAPATLPPPPSEPPASKPAADTKEQKVSS